MPRKSYRKPSAGSAPIPVHAQPQFRRPRGPEQVYDTALKMIGFKYLPSLLRLASKEPVNKPYNFADVTAITTVRYADQLPIFGDNDDPNRFGIHLEFVKRVNGADPVQWLHKAFALNVKLDRPIVLVAVYLSRGTDRTFPDSYVTSGLGFTNEHRFSTICLWEHADLIRTELKELVPLLVLCDDEPKESTLWEERRLIHESLFPPEQKNELLSVAYLVASRLFKKEFLESVFGKEEVEAMRQTTIVDKWVNEGIAQGRAEGLSQGLSQGVAQGIAEGETRIARMMVMEALRDRFGEPPTALVDKVNQADVATCRRFLQDVLHAIRLEDLNW